MLGQLETESHEELGFSTEVKALILNTVLAGVRRSVELGIAEKEEDFEVKGAIQPRGQLLHPCIVFAMSYKGIEDGFVKLTLTRIKMDLADSPINVELKPIRRDGLSPVSLLHFNSKVSEAVSDWIKSVDGQDLEKEIQGLNQSLEAGTPTLSGRSQTLLINLEDGSVEYHSVEKPEVGDVQTTRINGQLEDPSAEMLELYLMLLVWAL